MNVHATVGYKKQGILVDALSAGGGKNGVTETKMQAVINNIFVRYEDRTGRITSALVNLMYIKPTTLNP